MSTTRLLLADDHALVRAGIRALVERLPGVEVVGEAADGCEALELIKTTAPDVLLLDISMERLGGLEALPMIVKDFPEVKVVILSGHSNREYVLLALRGGAVGYILKEAAPQELAFAIKAVMKSHVYLSPAISRTLVESCLNRDVFQKTPIDALTPRQREILQFIAEGMNAKEIAGKIGVSVKTVEAHRSQLMDRLNIHDVPGLVRCAIRAGLVSVGR